jgi:hypothetical protein
MSQRTTSEASKSTASPSVDDLRRALAHARAARVGYHTARRELMAARAVLGDEAAEACQLVEVLGYLEQPEELGYPAAHIEGELLDRGEPIDAPAMQFSTDLESMVRQAMTLNAASQNLTERIALMTDAAGTTDHRCSVVARDVSARLKGLMALQHNAWEKLGEAIDAVIHDRAVSDAELIAPSA